jgi:TatD DNase family protein
VGEIGLDHALENRDDREQEEVFLAQLKISRERKVPVSIHCRRAWGRMMELLREAGPHPAGMIMHSFSGGAGLVPGLCELNAYFSFSASLTFPGNKRGPKALRAVPEERLLLETDAPDIPPAERTRECPGGKPVNEPAWIRHTLTAAARYLECSEEELARRTADNGLRLFQSILKGCLS